LTQQIENSAPFDVLAAADAEHVEELDQKGFLAKGSAAVYATGVLALWIPPQSGAAVNRIEDLTTAQARTIAVAKPELAPYGQATVDTLHHLGIWEKVKSKLVYAENISMAKEYGTTGNADAVFTAYSLVLSAPGKVIQVDESFHHPLTQKLGIVARSAHQENAHKFVDFLLNGKGKDVLASYGYRIAR
jgi:molybdate transport system substrate-binding protein